VSFVGPGILLSKMLAECNDQQHNIGSLARGVHYKVGVVVVGFSVHYAAT